MGRAINLISFHFWSSRILYRLTVSRVNTLALVTENFLILIQQLRRILFESVRFGKF